MEDRWRFSHQETRFPGHHRQHQKEAKDESLSCSVPASRPSQRSSSPTRRERERHVRSRLFSSASTFALPPVEVQRFSNVHERVTAPVGVSGVMKDEKGAPEHARKSTILLSQERLSAHRTFPRRKDSIDLPRKGIKNDSPALNPLIMGWRHKSTSMIGLPEFSNRPVKGQQTHIIAQPPTAPTPTDLYLAQARLPILRRATPQRLLVVLDLNGTLLVRPDRGHPSKIIVRPGVHALLQYIIDNHAGMIYSSARSQNVEAMVDSLLGPVYKNRLVAIWGREKLDLTPTQFNEKVQVYKKLDKIWKDERIQACSIDHQRWNQNNTILIDDNHLKALAQPNNLIQVPEFKKTQTLSQAESGRERQIMQSTVMKLEDLKWSLDVSRHIRQWQTGGIEPPSVTTPGNKINLAGCAWPPCLTVTSTDDTTSINLEGAEERGGSLQAALEKGMEDLTTDPASLSLPQDKIHLTDSGFTAEEWKEFLK